MKKLVLSILLMLSVAVPSAFSAQSAVVGSGVNMGSVNAQTGTSYTLVAADQGKLVTFNNASAVAVTLPQATGQFGDGWFIFSRNYGAGTVTFTPTTSTIDGGATATMATDQSYIIFSDGTNYKTLKPAAGSSGYTTTQDEGSNLTARATLNFIGPNVSCADNSGSSKTDCTVGSLIACQDAATTTLTGTAADADLYSCSLTMADGECVRSEVAWTYSTATAVGKTPKWSFGATQQSLSSTSSATTNAANISVAMFCNNPSSHTAQSFWNSVIQYGSSSAGSITYTTSSTDTSSSFNLKFQLNMPATEVATRRYFVVYRTR